MNWWKIANNHMKDTTPPSGNDNSKIDANRFARYTDDEVRKILDRAYKANAPQGIIDELETELDRREREEDDPSGGDDEPNRSNMGYGIEELMRQAALRGRMENMSPAQLGAEIRTDGDFAVMTQASPLATVSDAELGQEAYDALRAHEERIAAIRGRMSNRAHAVPYKMADNHMGDTTPPSDENNAGVDAGISNQQSSIVLSQGLREEIEFYLEQSEGEMTVGDVIRDMIADMDIRGTNAYEFRKELQGIGIRYGVFKPYTKSQIDQIKVTRGKAYDFKRGEVFYVFDTWDRLEASLQEKSLK